MILTILAVYSVIGIWLVRREFFLDRRHNDPALRDKVFIECVFFAIFWPMWLFLAVVLAIVLGAVAFVLAARPFITWK